MCCVFCLHTRIDSQLPATLPQTNRIRESVVYSRVAKRVLTFESVPA